MRSHSAALAAVAALAALAARPAAAQNLAEFEKRVTEFALENGLTCLVIERHQAPVVTCFTYAAVGSADEVKGITGMAHLFEHMAFKGTKRIGTRDYAAEKAAMDRADRAFLALKEERWKGTAADASRIEQLEREFEVAQKEGDRHIAHDEFDRAYEVAGSPDLNAFTSEDATCYFSSLPANKLELWMSLESDRFFEPVLREFHKERNVVAEERRLSENDPQSRLYEDFLSVAFKAHPYGEPVIGHMSDILSMTRPEAEAWFAKHYCASNLTVALVGDVDPRAARALAQTYLGRLPRGERPPPVETAEPEQHGERRCTVVAEAQPLLLIGYHRPGMVHADAPALDVLAEVLGEGRTSRLHRALVQQKKIATDVSAMPLITGGKYPTLLAISAVPAQGHGTAENERAVYEEIDRLASAAASEEELAKARTNVRARALRQLRSNWGLAYFLAMFESLTGDWRNLFRRLDAIDKVSAADVTRVAARYLKATNRTVGTIETGSETEKGGGR